MLEEVTEDGSSHFLTEGFIRASHAKTEPNGVYESLGLSYHRGYREDVVELKKEEPLKLCFHLEALSRVLHKGSRLRLAISCGGSGFRQPDGFPEEAPVITLYTGKQYPSGLRLPVIRPTATEFSSGSREVYAYKKAVYIKENGKFRAFPCQQVYPAAENTLVYETEKFCLTVRTEGQKAYAKIADADYAFEAETVLKDRFYFAKAEEEIPLSRHPWSYYPKVYRKNLYVATVPVAKGCIRYLKAHAEELGLDKNRFGVIGGSMGGNLASMLAASNGEAELEDRIGGNTEQDSTIKAAAAYFAFTDYLHFGEDSAEI